MLTTCVGRKRTIQLWAAVVAMLRVPACQSENLEVLSLNPAGSFIFFISFIKCIHWFPLVGASLFVTLKLKKPEFPAVLPETIEA